MRSRTAGRPTLFLFFTAAAVLVACGSEQAGPEPAADSYAVDLMVGADGIQIRGVQPMPLRRLWRHRDALTSLEYVLVDRDGNQVIRSRMPDFRWARSEVLDPETGLLTAEDFRMPSGLGTIRLPAVAGELVISEPTEGGLVELGRAPYDPAAAATALRRPLDDDEVLGGPVLIAGGGSKAGAIDILLLPEAYKEDQLTAFHETATRMADELLFQPDFAAYKERINVWYIDVKSKEDKLDSGGWFGKHYDTAFDARWGGGGILGIIGNAPDNCVTYGDAGDARDLGEEHDMDAVAMVANVDDLRGLQADDLISIGRQTSGITLAHELGHLILDLGDEYTDAGGAFEGFRCSTHSFFGLHQRANVQADTKDLPWWDLLTPGISLPTPDDAGEEVVGAFEGANHCESNWYRPQIHCLMRDHAPMCAVCRREFDTLMGGLSTEPPSCPESWRDDGICDLCLDDDPDCEVQRVCNSDGVCDQKEHCSGCPEDCGACPVGGGCGDGACAQNESDSSCPVDCGCSAGALCTNGPAPYGCYCDAQCEDAGDCCADYTPTCE